MTSPQGKGSSDGRDGARRPTSPGFTFMAVSVAVSVAVSFLSFTARQPPPPTIAEFAPQAIERIQDAPPEQSSDTGTGDGIGGPGSDPARDPANDPEIPPIEVPRVRRCVGNPPRQTEDPQSPPCVPYWDGDNGGATARGVTGDEIKLMIPTPESDRVRNLYVLLERFFNKRFEFYGRKVTFQYGSGSGSADAAQQRAHAADYFQRFQPFASTAYKAALGTAYSNEMARRNVITMTKAFINVENSFLWRYEMDADGMFSNLADWACRRLKGRNAVHAGSDDLRATPRSFGIILDSGYEEDRTTPAALERGLRACGATIADTSVNEFETKNDPVTASTILLRMRNAGATSIFCLCQLFAFGIFQQAATGQSFFPEWLISTYGFADLNGFIKLGGNAREQMENTFGVSFLPMQVPLVDEPFYWAAREIDPGFTWTDESATIEQAFLVYRTLLVLVSGLQMAGPTLTPETFEQGLERAAFPNPTFPTMPGAVGFADGAHSMMRDGAEIWWSNTAPGPNAGDGAGTYCYVDRGARRSIGTWPRRDGPFFRGPCFSGAR